MKNFKKSAKGFTLVELIVVIAIIGVLAAILVPAMMGWIAKANMQSANAGAKEIYTNAQSISQEAEEVGLNVIESYHSAELINDGEGGEEDSDISSETSEDFRAEMVRKMADAKSAHWAVIFAVPDADGSLPANTDLGTCLGAAYSKGDINYIGLYPAVSANKKGWVANHAEYDVENVNDLTDAAQLAADENEPEDE
jgi:type IV pilus assembly protein PilA